MNKSMVILQSGGRKGPGCHSSAERRTPEKRKGKKREKVFMHVFTRPASAEHRRLIHYSSTASSAQRQHADECVCARVDGNAVFSQIWCGLVVGEVKERQERWWRRESGSGSVFLDGGGGGVRKP